MTNEVIFKPGRADVISALVEYARAGGRVILGGSLQSFCSFPEMEDYFKAFALQWKVAGYHRTTHHLLSTHPLIPSFSPPLLPSYSMKSVFLKNVPDDEAIYRPGEASTTESRVFPRVPVEEEETPIAMGRVGEGWFGWAGDVNAEEGTRRLVLGLLGLDTT